jgi:hypothetical protein
MPHHSFEKVLNLTLIALFVCVLVCVSITNRQRLIVAENKSPTHTAQTPVKYSILIDTQNNILYLLKNGQIFKLYSCATGTSETPSPLGYFKVVKKGLWGEGFGGYFLGLNCAWGDYGIHGTTLPESIGDDSSHGCFRMFNFDVQELYHYVGLGTPVLVIGGCYGIFGNKLRVIHPGMYGADIQAVEYRLRDLGFYDGKCNGKYDDAGFRTAIHLYQVLAGLPVSDDISQQMQYSMGFVLME